ncbi:Regulatory protein RecX [Anaerolineales bacterium]|nr:Regulatory protein RecX [Anaerolineales bacterium]
MKKITAIKVQKKSPNRLNIYLDGEFAFGLAHITAAWLKVGDVLSDEKIAKLLNEDSRERAYQQAMLFLSYRARSEKEIRQNLRKHEISEEVIEETLERLRKAGLANDNDFARAWVENRSTFRPRSKKALAIEMRQKGLDDEAIQASLSDVDEEALAYETGLKRAARFKGLEQNEFRKKLSEFLARRGFSYSVVVSVVSRIWNETHADILYEYENEDML